MSPTAILLPMLSVMMLTLVVWVYMYAKRIPFIVKNQLTEAQLEPEEFARIQPNNVSNPSDNLKNLFEIPSLFYVVCLLLFVTNSVDIYYFVAGWMFVLFRVLHSLVHCTFNLVILRFWLYAISCVALFLMIVRLFLHHLGVLV